MAEHETSSGSPGSEAGRLLLAAVIGGLIGAAVGLLLAPKPGADLRSDIRGKASVAAEKAQVVQAKAKDLVQAAKQKLEEHRAGREAEAEDIAAESQTEL